MPRNTFIFIVILAIFTTFVVVANFLPKSTPGLTSLPISNGPTPIPESRLLHYFGEGCGIELDYPNDFNITEATLSAILVNDKSNESIVVICQKQIPRVPLPPNKIDKFEVRINPISDGKTVAAKLYHDASAKNGTAIDKLIFHNPTSDLDVLLGGYGETFASVAASLRILPYRYK